MKNSLLLFVLLLCSTSLSWGQYTWSNIPADPFTVSASAPADVVMYNEMLYHVFDSGGFTIKITVYNPKTSQWKPVKSRLASNFTNGIQAKVVNGSLAIMVQHFSGFTPFIYDFSSNDLFEFATANFYSSISGNWEFAAQDNGTKLFVANVDNGSSIFMNEFDIITNTWVFYDISSVLNSGFNTISGASIEVYLSNSKIYCGVHNPGANLVRKLGYATLSNLSSFVPYNTSGTNDGSIYLNGSLGFAGSFYLTGDGQNPPSLTVNDSINGLAYEKALTLNDFNAVPGTDSPNTFKISSNDHFSLSNSAYSFLTSNFADAGIGTPYDKFYVYRKDLGTGIWDSIGPKIEFGAYIPLQNSIRTTLDTQFKHLSVSYRDVNNGSNFKVLNQVPSLVIGASAPNSGLCVGNENQLYPSIIFGDDDLELVRIVGISSSNSTMITNFRAVGIGTDFSAAPGYSKYAIYGDVNSSGSTTITITFTDGWNIFSYTLPVLTISQTPPLVGFTANPIVFCENENLIDLNDFVNYTDQNRFSINGQLIQGSTLNGMQLSQTNPTGTLDYKVNVAGCIVSSATNYNFAQVGTAASTTTPSDCGSNTGSASIVFTQGTSASFTVEWSTGETTSTISNLAPGAYYYHVIDEYNCKTTGFAGVETSGITITPTITPITCNGANNGAISLAVSGPADFNILWSNGFSTPSISNLAPGNYLAHIRDNATNCIVTYSYNLVEPTPIRANFNTFDPDCGFSNGIIYGTYSGGNAPYTFDWLGTAQTTPDLNNVPYGFYQVKVTDNTGCQTIFDFQLDDYQAVDIKDSVVFASCLQNDGNIFVQFEQDQFGGTLANEITWSNGNETVNNLHLSQGSYTITAKSGFSNNCFSQKTIVVGVRSPARQDICIVTVDTITTTNEVVWEKTQPIGIDYYKIYREDAMAGEFKVIDTVDFNSLSVFNDVVASPVDKSWRYKISAVNLCGVEGPVSSMHKTLHLNAFEPLGNGDVNIFWDDYEGNADVADYVVWRKTDGSPWTAVSPNIPIGTSSFLDTPPAGSTGLDYYVEMLLGSLCTAEKAQDFNTVRSNKDKGGFLAGNGTGNSSNGLTETQLGNSTVLIYPNPNQGEFKIDVQGIENCNYTVIGLTGNTIQKGQLQAGINSMKLNHVQAGIYLIVLEQKEERKSLRLTIE